MIDGEEGLVHLTNQGETSWSDCASVAADLTKVDRSLVVGCDASDLGFKALRPSYIVLRSERFGRMMPSFESGLSSYIHQIAEGASR